MNVSQRIGLEARRGAVNLKCVGGPMAQSMNMLIGPALRKWLQVCEKPRANGNVAAGVDPGVRCEGVPAMKVLKGDREREQQQTLEPWSQSGRERSFNSGERSMMERHANRLISLYLH